MLRTDRVTVWVSTGESEHLNCSIVGFGDTAQASCTSHTSAMAVPRVYHVALIVGSNQVGYVVSCGGGLLSRIGCHPLSLGQVLKGSVHGDTFSIPVDNKTKTYRIETSAYIGPLTTKSSPVKSPTAPHEDSKPGVNAAIYAEPSAEPGSAAVPVQPTSVDTAAVAFSSEPRGADIYVDDNFVGNTPSLIQLPPGSHTVRIEAKGHNPWTRVLNLTAGGKVTVQADLGAELH